MPSEGLTREEYQTLVKEIKVGLIQELHDRKTITEDQFESLLKLQEKRESKVLKKEKRP